MNAALYAPEPSWWEIHADMLQDANIEKALVVTHYDLDGFVCALCLLEAFNLPTGSVRFLSYGAKRDQIIEGGIAETRARTLFICDIGLASKDLSARWATQPELRRILFDHHESTELLDLSNFHEVHLDASGERCSADLALEYIRQHAPQMVTPKLARWVALARDRDLWHNQQRQMGRRVSWLLKEHIHERLETAILTTSPDEFLRKLQGLWRRGETLFEDAVVCARNTAHLFTDTPVPIKIAYVKRDTSDIADELQDGGQLVVLLNVFGARVGVSLRTDLANVNVAEIARKCFGGGGHRLAASGLATQEHLLGGYVRIKEDIVAALAEQVS